MAVMEKRETIVLRISEENKANIKAAADRRGLSLTTFITDAALSSARRVTKLPHGAHTGVPSFFRAGCREAAHGGSNNYSGAAWHLANSIGSQIPYDLEVQEWAKLVAKLIELIDSDDEQGVWDWFKQHYPKCMALVPSRRREQFVEGVRRAHEDGRLGI